VSRGILDVNYGSVYPTLRRLEARGLLKAYWASSENNRRARYYELTTAGQKELALQKQEWEKRALAVGLILQSD
jgi:PadR family transcriptional regulator, regulatory protein PadR